MTREEAKEHFWSDTDKFGESVAKKFGSINYKKIFTGYYIGSEIDKFIDIIYDEFENRKCENCNYFTGKVCYLHEGWNEDVGVVHPIMEKDDGCNKWEDKNKEN